MTPKLSDLINRGSPTFRGYVSLVVSYLPNEYPLLPLQVFNVSVVLSHQFVAFVRLSFLAPEAWLPSIVKRTIARDMNTKATVLEGTSALFVRPEDMTFTLVPSVYDTLREYRILTQCLCRVRRECRKVHITPSTYDITIQRPP